MSRAITLKNLHDKKFKVFPFEGIWADVMGQPELTGAWLIYGAEKNGKTWFSLKLAEYLSSFAKTLYVSAEEGTGKTFVDACKRAKLDARNRNLQFLEYTLLVDLNEKIAKRKSAKIIFIDNITIYSDELKNGGLRDMLKQHTDKLLVFVAHEDRKEPYTATAKLCRRLAKVIVRVQGLMCFVSGRCPGGTLMIDEDRARLFHGTELKQ